MLGNNIQTHIFCYSLLFLGTMFYTLAAYYHLKYNQNWTFLKALTIALPFVLIEYTFSLRGIHHSYKYLNHSTSTILIITIIFCFISMWLFNYFILKKNKTNINLFKEILAFILIIIAFYISNVIN
jgi:hypothetical protein